MISLERLLSETARVPSPTRAQRTRFVLAALVLGVSPALMMLVSSGSATVTALLKLLLVLAVTAPMVVLTLRLGSSVPPSRGLRAVVVLVAPAALLVGGALSSLLGAPTLSVDPLHCLMHGFLGALPPGIALCALVWRADPVHTGTAGALVGATAATAGQLAVMVLCPDAGAVHVLTAHVGAVLAGTAVGMVLSAALGLRHLP